MGYLDCVLDRDMKPVYNSTPEEVQAFLEMAKDISKLDVCYGKNLKIVTAQDYLSMAQDGLTPTDVDTLRRMPAQYYGPEATIQLPSGKTIEGEELQRLLVKYGPTE